MTLCIVRIFCLIWRSISVNLTVNVLQVILIKLKESYITFREEIIMEREVSAGAMLGIILIALAAIIGISFGVFAIVKATSNSGSVQVADSLNRVSDSFFTDFDDHLVSGTEVKMALTQLRGRPYAILLNTSALGNAATLYDHKQEFGMYMVFPNSAGENGKYVVNFNALLNRDGSSARLGGEFKANTKMTSTFVSIHGNAEDISNPGKYIYSGNSVSDSWWTLYKNGYIESILTFVTQDGNVVYDTDYNSIYAKGDVLYVESNSKFKSCLLKTSAGAIQGIVFEQVPLQK